MHYTNSALTPEIHCFFFVGSKSTLTNKAHKSRLAAAPGREYPDSRWRIELWRQHHMIRYLVSVLLQNRIKTCFGRVNECSTVLVYVCIYTFLTTQNSFLYHLKLQLSKNYPFVGWSPNFVLLTPTAPEVSYYALHVLRVTYDVFFSIAIVTITRCIDLNIDEIVTRRCFAFDFYATE